MAIKSVLIDTNAYAAFKKGEPDALEILQKVNVIVINPIVIGELIGGFMLGNREERNRSELIQFLKTSKVNQVIINTDTSEFFASIFKELRSKGKPIPTNDIWIAATAIQHDLAVFSYDKHFKNVDGLNVIVTPKDIS